MNIIRFIRNYILNWRRNRFEQQMKRLNPNQFRYKLWEHRTWGDNIEIRKVHEKYFSVVGWLQRLPKLGDELIYETPEGQIALGCFINVEYCGNPKDMFFADIVPLNITHI